MKEKGKQMIYPFLVFLLFAAGALLGEKEKRLELFGAGIAAAAVTVYVQKEEKEKKLRNRKKKLFLEYPEFVSKLSLLLGSGMAVLTAFRKMDEMNRKQTGEKEKIAYTELSKMIYEIDNGVSELRAYQLFGERCGIQPYRRLASLLLSAQQLGNRRLTERLNEEADRVFTERKNAARRLGEEAASKLLFPMMLMLAVIMGIILVPAFLSIYATL